MRKRLKSGIRTRCQCVPVITALGKWKQAEASGSLASHFRQIREFLVRSQKPRETTPMKQHPWLSSGLHIHAAACVPTRACVCVCVSVSLCVCVCARARARMCQVHALSSHHDNHNTIDIRRSNDHKWARS